MRDKQLTNHSNLKRDRSIFSWTLCLGIGIASLLLAPSAAVAEPEDLEWARVDFLSNRVQLVPREQRSRRARIADVLSIGDALRTARESRAELRFNDGSLARIGERATFRFTPNTRNFQLSNGTALLLIPPGKGRSTVQTPNAVTGIQGSALFVRYIPETNTTIVGALTDNPMGPMVLFNEDGSERQALNSNEIGVIEGDQITQIYEFDGALFWQTSGLTEGLDYLSTPSQLDSPIEANDPLEGVRQEIRDALLNQSPLEGDGIIENPDSFSRPTPSVEELPQPDVVESVVEESQEPTATSDAEAGSTDSVDSATSETSTETTDSGSVGSGTANPGTITTKPETSDTSEELDLQVALDLELELELEADGVEAPDLEINETVQQYLEGDNSEISSSSDVRAGNSLQSINADETEEEESGSPSASANDNLTGEDATDEEVSASEVDNGAAPATENDATVTNGSAGTADSVSTDSGSNDNLTENPHLSNELNSSSSRGDSPEPASNPSTVPTVENSPSPTPGSEPLADPVGNSQVTTNQRVDVSDATGSQPDLNSSLPADAAGSHTNDATIATPVVPNSTPDTSSALSSPPMELPTATPVPEIGSGSSVPTDIPGTAIEDTSVVSPAPINVPVNAPINVIDIAPAADEPPVQIFLPTDKIDFMMHTMDREEDMNHNMDDDGMD
ncbi:FecR domain-containing protein [cf. Phormidesmis sp. LEGE 11477]|uniref:FecR domain-containing protein n=1 Tax=cf. Phormidesmis sp. LEGE 11477 TaxID=1828680 RepID=UPI001880C570|nr:FecR domain-containing protein [cf. Phormidesmis sp. LEGE 11477]MBE9063374.1 FecR domain-containing protein [cf. Phormidesmis sp. LEGE 11477]